MKKYNKVDVSEQELEDLVRRHPGEIEKGLAYLDHQKQAAGDRLDVLLADSGKSLVVAELKVIQDDGMPFQGLDYYDQVSTHLESFARLYKSHEIDPTQRARLFLIAPTFSQALVNRCKWLDLPISLFSYICLKFEGEPDLIPIFTEQQITAPPEVVEVAQLSDHLNYITDTSVRGRVDALLQEIKNWRPGSISMDPTKYGISMKINGRVFAYLWPRRQHFVISTYDAGDEWITPSRRKTIWPQSNQSPSRPWRDESNENPEPQWLTTSNQLPDLKSSALSQFPHTFTMDGLRSPGSSAAYLPNWTQQIATCDSHPDEPSTPQVRNRKLTYY